MRRRRKNRRIANCPHLYYTLYLFEKRPSGRGRASAIIYAVIKRVLERLYIVNNRKMASLEKRVPARAVAALSAASRRAAASQLPCVVVIENGLYRISASGARELIRTLPQRMRAPGRAKRSKG